MKRTAAYRITADLCFYFSILSIFPALRPWQTPMALFAAAVLAVSLIAVYCPYGPLRFLLALLPGLCFLKAPLSWLLFFPALGWLYVILMLTMGNFALWLDEYRRNYGAMLVIVLCSLAANIAHSIVTHGQVISLPSLIYAFAFLCLGVLAMRQMQMNANMSLNWRLYNAAVVVGAPVLAVGISLLLFKLLRSLRPVVSYLFRPIGLFFIWLFNLLFPGGLEEAASTPMPTLPPLPTPAFVEEATGHGNMVMDDMADKLNMDSLLMEKAISIGAYVVCGVLVLLALFLVVRIVRRNRRYAEENEFFYEEAEEGEATRKKRSRRDAPMSGSAQQIRRIYRQYMELMRANGVHIQRDSTSKDILEEAEQISLSPEADRLRELYLKARYGEDEAVTPQDVQEAKDCLKAIAKDENWKR